MSTLGSIVTTISINLFTWPATSICPCLSFFVLIIKNTADTNLYFAFWFASTLVVTKWIASQVPSSIPLFSSWAKNVKLKWWLTFFHEPAWTKAIVVRVEKENWGQEVVIVVKLGIPLEDKICFLLHFKQLCRRIHWFLFSRADHDWGEVLVGPGRPVRIAVFVVLTLEEFFPFLRVHRDFCKRFGVQNENLPRG